MPELLIMNWQKVMCLKVENITWLDSLNYLAMSLRKLPDAFGLTPEKSWYPHLSNTDESFNYVRPDSDISYYDVHQMRESEKKKFLSWYDTNVKKEVLDNQLVL